MKRLKEKLKSRDGASLILSLLVFLVCVMAAASVLAAAVSNVGRARSSRVEQQRYQTLSSAVRLICGELEKVEYTGKYKSYTWEEGGTEYFYYEQQNGEFKMQAAYESQPFRLADFSFMEGALRKEMDEVFRRQFRKDDGSAKDGCSPLPDSEVTEAGAAQIINLKVTLPDDLAGYPYTDGSMPEEYKIPKTANVKIELDHNPIQNNITLTAWLDDSGAAPAPGSVKMVAVLKADTAPAPEAPDPAQQPGTALPGTAAAEEKTVSVKWKLESVNMRTEP